jgi:hypothetical protein
VIHRRGSRTTAAGDVTADQARHEAADAAGREKLSPDRQLYYVTDMMSDGVWLIDAKRFTRVGFVHTGNGAQRLYVTGD